MVAAARMAVATAFLFLLLAVVTLATSTVLIARQQREAERQRDEARQAVDDMYTDVAERVADTAGGAGADAAEVLAEGTGLLPAIRRGGEHRPEGAVEDGRGVPTGWGSSRKSSVGTRKRKRLTVERWQSSRSWWLARTVVPEYRSELARIQSNLGHMLKGTGQHAEAEQLLRRAIALREKLVADAFRASIPERAGRNYANLGMLLATARLAGPSERTAGPSPARELAADSPSHSNTDRLANSHNNLGVLLSRPADWRGRAAYRRAIALERSWRPTRPPSPIP